MYLKTSSPPCILYTGLLCMHGREVWIAHFDPRREEARGEKVPLTSQLDLHLLYLINQNEASAHVLPSSEKE